MVSKEIELIELKEKLKKAEEADNSQDNYLWSAIFGFIIFTGLSIFIYIKKILDEYWIYAFSLFAVLAVIGLILVIFAYGWSKEAINKVKKLKRAIKELKNSI